MLARWDRIQRQLLEAKKRGGQCVYIIQAESGPLKVGIADSPTKRFGQIQASCWEDLEIVKVWWTPGYFVSQRVESAAHTLLAEYRIRGEWFNASVDQASEAVEAAIAEVLEGSPGAKLRQLPSRDSRKEYLALPKKPDRLLGDEISRHQPARPTLRRVFCARSIVRHHRTVDAQPMVAALSARRVRL